MFGVLHPFQHKMSQHRIGVLLAFTSLVWAGTFNALAKGLTPYLSPMSLLLMSEALTALFIVVTFGLVPLFRLFLTLDRRTIFMAAFVGLLNSALAPYLWFSGLSLTTATNASMLSSVEVLCVVLCGAFILKENLSRMQIIGGSIVLIGVLIIQISGQSLDVAFRSGDILVFLGAVVSGFGAVLFKKFLSHVMPELAILIRNIAGFSAAFIAAMFFEHPFLEEVSAFPVAQVLLLLAFAFFSRYLNHTCYYEALDRLPASAVSLIQIATPLAGVLFAFLILGESVDSHQILGGIFIIIGLALEHISSPSLASLPARFWGLMHHAAPRTAPMLSAPAGIMTKGA